MEELQAQAETAEDQPATDDQPLVDENDQPADEE